MRKVLILLAGLVSMTGCTTPTEQRAELEGVRVPTEGVEYVVQCERNDGSQYTQVRTFRRIDDQRLRVEIHTRERTMWIEKLAKDLGIWVYEKADFGDGQGISESIYEVDGLDQVRRLVPGTRAEGHVDYLNEGAWDRFNISVEVFPPNYFEHPALGKIQAVQITSTRWKADAWNRRWNSSEKKFYGDFRRKDTSSMAAFVDLESQMVVSYLYSDGERQTNCYSLQQSHSRI